jgi:isoleucyl-tRNA synthetase
MSTDATKKSYKDTLNLPQTAFPMEAKLVQNEPARLKRWQEAKLYDQLLAARAQSPRWVLHDGPPFANGDIHIGHVINKTLKDVILRFRTMQGYQTPYVPGWDCHGLPIEHQIQEQVKKEGKNYRELGVVDVRQRCFAHASKFAKAQSEQFQRLGILGDWDNPYLTMAPAYEASTLEVFAKFVEAGLVYKQLKPVPWSVANQTALADAELEYEDVTDPSVYVEFPAVTATEHANLHLLVWTTTPWTLPANLAVAVAPKGEYSFVRYERDGQTKVGVVATNLVELVFKNRQDVTSYETVATKLGEELLDLEYRHPFVDRTGKVLPADYVTVGATEGEEPGTGLVHTAPGHGEDDYVTGVKFGLDVYSPVLANGRFDDTVPEFVRGKTTKEGNALITDELKRRGVLFAAVPITHRYPHDWRSKTPIIFRATEQWFVAMDKDFLSSRGNDKWPMVSLRTRAQWWTDADYIERVRRENPYEELVVSKTVDFVPPWGRNRLLGMIASRPDWCVSRQRAWGLPIPVFYNEQGESLLTPMSVRAVAKRFAEKGSDAWFTDSPTELLGDFDPGPAFPKDKLRKETDIFDVWFESGSSWHACLQARPDLAFPADLYLEGSDQHRGWFQLSLLPALGATGRPPFKQVLTHGFVVKPDGKKVSKSDKEYVKAVDEINRHGADLLRLWTSSVDYQNDIPTSPKVLQEFGDKYRKIRNTLRYLLSNLYDFNPATDAQEVPQNSLDGWALAELDSLIVDVRDAYDAYQLHLVFKRLHEFCTVQLSAMYGNAMKDRLYCDAPTSPLRRRTQTVMHRMAVALTKLLAPICVFTADEAWEQIAHKPAEDAGLTSVHLALLPKPSGVAVSEDQQAEWKLLMDLRSDALGQLDKLTRQIGKYKALDAEVVYHVDDDATRRKLQAYGVDLADMVGCGFHSFAEKGPAGPAVVVEVLDRREKYAACARSWKRRPDVGADAEYPDLTLRDAAAVRAIAATA